MSVFLGMSIHLQPYKEPAKMHIDAIFLCCSFACTLSCLWLLIRRAHRTPCIWSTYFWVFENRSTGNLQQTPRFAADTVEVQMLGRPLKTCEWIYVYICACKSPHTHTWFRVTFDHTHTSMHSGTTRMTIVWWDYYSGSYINHGLSLSQDTSL